MKQEKPKGVYRWALGYLRPYRKRLFIFLFVSAVEIVSGLLLPWPMKFIVDHALGSEPASGLMVGVIGFLGANRVAMMALGCVAYLIFHYASEFISVAHTQMQQSIGQRLIFDLRRQMFAHLQSLSLRYHLKRGPGETIYHIENDSYCVDSLSFGGHARRDVHRAAADQLAGRVAFVARRSLPALGKQLLFRAHC